MVKYFIFVFLFWGFINVGICALNVGDKAPDFLVRTGDKKELTLKDCERKIVVMFYETKDNKEENRRLKDFLKQTFSDIDADDKERILWTPVVNCSATFPFTPIWESELVKSSKKEEMNIYGDWDGKVIKNYDFHKKEPNFAVIDEEGVVVYVKKGILSEDDFFEIKKIIEELIRNKK